VVLHHCADRLVEHGANRLEYAVLAVHVLHTVVTYGNGDRPRRNDGT
jgi:hypothetical protein